MDRFLRFLSRMLSHIAALLLLMAGGVNTAWAQSGDTPLFGRGGFIPLFGGLGETAGVSGGVRYDAFLRHPNLTLAADVRASIRTYAGVRLMTGFENDRFSLYGYGRYRYQPKEVFYGLGPSDRDTASDYRLDERIAGASGSVKPFDGVAIGINASVIDKPFVVGDFLAVDEYLGSVDRIGLKTTRLQSLSGEQLVFSNTDLLESRIRNYKRMFERRVVFEIGVEYDTERQKLAQISEWIEEIVKAQELTRFDRAHLAKIGPYAFNYEIVYYVLDPSFNVYMDIQQAINIAIVERFDEERISLSYPTQRLHGSLLALPEQDA